MGFRYVRMRVLSTIGDSTNIHVAALEFTSSVGGVNLAVNPGNAVASTEASVTAKKIASAFDGNDMTYWESASVSGATISDSTGNNPTYRTFHLQQYTVTYDFGVGVDVDIEEIRILPYVSGGVVSSGTPRDMLFQVSNDGINWELLAIFMRSAYTSSKKSFLVNDYRNKPISNRILPSFIKRTRPIGFNGHINRLGFFNTHNGKLVRQVTSPYAGGASIAGVTTVLGQPISRKVNLYDQRRYQLIATTTSGEDGIFRFDFLREGPYSIMGVDITANQNSVIFAHVEAINQ
jgi:hypothetical protein